MKAPPSIGTQSAAPGADPVLPGITIVSSSDHGSTHRWSCAIRRGEEDAAVNSLLDALDASTRFMLMDGNPRDNESAGSYEWVDGKISYMLGGHGWRADPEFLDRTAAFALARRQAPFNYGPPKGDCGFFERKVIGYRPPVESEPHFTPLQKALGWLWAKLSR